MNYATQEKIRKDLYNGKIDILRATNDELDLYKKIIQNSLIRSKKIIDQNLNLFWFWGIVCAGLSLYCGLFYYNFIIYPYIIKLGQAEGFLYAIKFNKDFIVHNYDLAFVYAIPLFMALLFGFLAYKSLYTAVYAKKNALSDLLRDEAMLARLEKVE